MRCKYTASLKFIFRSILIHQTHYGGPHSAVIILKPQPQLILRACVDYGACVFKIATYHTVSVRCQSGMCCLGL